MRNTLTKRFPIIAGVCMMMAFLQGCGNKVDCNGSKVKSDALEIIQSHLNQALWYRQIGAALSGSPELVNIQTLDRNDELKQAQCRATYTYTYNGKLREVGVTYTLAYLQDKGTVDVRVAVNDVMGGIAAIVMHESPIKNGLEKITDPATGNLLHTLEWKDGVQDGDDKLYNPATNKLIAQATFVKGTKTGSQKVWSNDGSTLLIDLIWDEGKATGYEKRYDAPGATLLTDITWKDGKQTGVRTELDPSGRKLDESHFKDGLLDGPHKHYTPTGVGPNDVALAKLDNYKAGKLDGVSQAFGDDGKVILEAHYRDGVELQDPPPAPAAQ